MNVATETEWKNIADDPALFHVACMLTPNRRGVRLFLAKLEHEHYNPAFGSLNRMQIRYIKWEGFEYTVVTVPIEDRPILHRVAEECKLYLHDGIPTVIDGRGQRWFPVSSPRVFSLLGYATMFPPKQRAEEELKVKGIRSRAWSVLGDETSDEHRALS